MAQATLENREGGETERRDCQRSPARRESKPGYPVHRRRPRKPVSCGPCRHSKLKCDRKYPCGSCKRRECAESCTYRRSQPDTPNLRPDAGPAPSPILISSQAGKTTETGDLLVPLEQSSSPAFSNSISTTSTAPQDRDPQNDTHSQWDALLQRPTDQTCQLAPDRNDPLMSPRTLCFPFHLGPTVSRSEIIAVLPPADCCDYLVTEYFAHLSPLFHILHGPTFQKQYNAFRQNHSHADLSWVALLFAICSATVNTMENDNCMLTELWSDASRPHNVSEMAYRFRTAAMTCLAQDQFMIRHNLSTLEAILILIYTISNHEGAERSWTLLGLTLNIGIALKCNVGTDTQRMDCIEVERRRRCWAGILLLHTYQATFFRDIDMSALLNIDATMPADVNDHDITANAVLEPSSQPTQMSLMRFKIQMFQLSTKICRHLASDSRYNEAALSLFDSQVAEEQRQWDSVFLLDGEPSLLDPASYAHWCILQLYAHQLYLLLHRPFCKPRGPYFRSASRAKCIISGTSLLDVHRQFCDLPRLRHYRWFLSGLTSFYAVHGAIALASCLLDEPKTVDLSPYRPGFDAAVERIDKLRDKSQVCAKAYPILCHLQALLSTERARSSTLINSDFGVTFDNWIDGVQWMNPESIDWAFWDAILASGAG